MDVKISIVGIVLLLAVVLGILTFPSQQSGVPTSSSEQMDSAPVSTSSGQAERTALTLISSSSFELTSGDLSYPAHLFEPQGGGEHPAVVLLHSINGLNSGYVTMSEELAKHGYVVLTIEWQNYERVPHDDVVIQLVRDGVALLSGMPNVDVDNIGLTGFCIGGRYTMLLLPQIDEFASGVAWYGFPYRGPDANENWPQAPADVIDQLDVPMLIMHGSHDNPSPITDIYQYAQDLDAAEKYFELKIYQGEPHSFMLDEGELNQSWVARDALTEMIDFFDRTLK